MCRALQARHAAPAPHLSPSPTTTLCSLHQAHFKLQRCQDRFASELGLSALKASAPAASTAPPVAASHGSLVAAAIAAEAQQALAAAAEVPVPGVRALTSESGAGLALALARCLLASMVALVLACFGCLPCGLLCAEHVLRSSDQCMEAGASRCARNSLFTRTNASCRGRGDGRGGVG